MIIHKRTYWDKLTPTDKSWLIPHISEFTCTGIHKSTQAFQFVNNGHALFIKPEDAEELIQNGIILTNVLLWPEHGILYLDFNKEFLKMSKHVMELSNLNFPYHHRPQDNDISTVGSGFDMTLPSSNILCFATHMDYTAQGVKLGCWAAILSTDEVGRTLLSADIMVPDDKYALKLMANLYKNTVTLENIQALEQKTQ